MQRENKPNCSVSRAAARLSLASGMIIKRIPVEYPKVNPVCSRGAWILRLAGMSRPLAGRPNSRPAPGELTQLQPVPSMLQDCRLMDDENDDDKQLLSTPNEAGCLGASRAAGTLKTKTAAEEKLPTALRP